MTVPIYLDYHGSTPTHPDVLTAMEPWHRDNFSNSASPYESGRQANDAVENAYAQVARCIGASPAEITFNSGATEGNNTIIKNALLARQKLDGRNKIITLCIEHRCVISSVAFAKQYLDADVVMIPITPDGVIDMDKLADALDDKTALVSVMAVNNEIGTIQPIAEITKMAHAVGAWMHTDIAQAVGRIPVDVADWGVDFATLSGYKIYAPKGIGALYMASTATQNHPNTAPKPKYIPFIHGGNQQGGHRAGTVPVALCVGMGRACEIMCEKWQGEIERQTALRDDLLTKLQAVVPNMVINGCMDKRVGNNLNITIAGVSPTDFHANIGGLCVSGGSACRADGNFSHVLSALGGDDGTASVSLRFGLGMDTTQSHIDGAVDCVVNALKNSAV